MREAAAQQWASEVARMQAEVRQRVEREAAARKQELEQQQIMLRALSVSSPSSTPPRELNQATASTATDMSDNLSTASFSSLPQLEKHIQPPPLSNELSSLPVSEV